jgi:hypothetical protein
VEAQRIARLAELEEANALLRAKLTSVKSSLV